MEVDPKVRDCLRVGHKSLLRKVQKGPKIQQKVSAAGGRRLVHRKQKGSEAPRWWKKHKRVIRAKGSSH